MIRSSSNYAFPQAVVLVCGGCIMYTLQIDHVTLALARSLALRHRQPSSWKINTSVKKQTRHWRKINAGIEQIIILNCKGIDSPPPSARSVKSKGQLNIHLPHSSITSGSTMKDDWCVAQLSKESLRLTLVSVHEQVLQLPHEPAAMQLRHLYNLGSWVRMWFRTFLSRKNILLQSCSRGE